MLIYFVSDLHLGRNFGFKQDPFTAISRRAMDPINNFKTIAQDAIKNEAALLVICGDLYDRPSIGSTFKRRIREDIFLPLYEKGIPVLIVGGNHDSPRNLKRGADIEDLSMLPNVDTFRLPKCKEVTVGDTKIGLILFPYLHPEVLEEYLKPYLDLPEIPANELYPRAQDFIKKWIGENLAELKDTDLKFLICHFYPKGAKIRETSAPEILAGEFNFTREMLNEDSFDLCAFGHVHLHQSMWKNLVIPGSIERMDFGERKDQKGYIVYNTIEKTWEFKPLECRNLITTEIDLSEVTETSSQTLIRKILGEIPSGLEDAWIRLNITLTSPQRNILSDLSLVEEALKPAFHYELRFINREMVTDTILTDFTLDPVHLFRDFIDQSLQDYPYKAELKAVGMEIINELLTEVEE